MTAYGDSAETSGKEYRTQVDFSITNSSSASSTVASSQSYLWKWPVPNNYTITSPVGMRVINGKSQYHDAIDIGASTGTPIVATKSGKVIKAGYYENYKGYGTHYIEIDHGNGYVSTYGHCSAHFVNIGDYVTQGQQIALVGAEGYVTGPHLDFRILYNGKQQNPSDFVKPSY